MKDSNHNYFQEHEQGIEWGKLYPETPINPVLAKHIEQLRSMKEFYENYEIESKFQKCCIDNIFQSLYETVEDITCLMGEEFKTNVYGEEVING